MDKGQRTPSFILKRSPNLFKQAQLPHGEMYENTAAQFVRFRWEKVGEDTQRLVEALHILSRQYGISEAQVVSA